MKFLCVACDEAMALKEARGPDEGSMAVIFACPACGREVAMLTNAMETQMVRSLGVKIGGRTVPHEPMENVRGTLAHQREGMPAPATSADGEIHASPGAHSASGCPFTEIVATAAEQQTHDTAVLRWTPEAEARIARIPSFARPMVRKSIEQHAREQGYGEIDAAVLDEVRGQFGM